MSVVIRVADSPTPAWQALNESGYVSEWVPEDLQSGVQNDYFRAWTASHHVTVVAELDGHPVATVAGYEEHPGRWLLHQLGRVPWCRVPNLAIDVILEMARTVVHGHGHGGPIAGGRYFTIFAEREAPHTKRLFTGFAENAALFGAHSKLSFVTVYRARADDGGAVSADIPALMECRSATPGVNLTGIADRCWFVCPPNSPEERLAQLQAARAWYRNSGTRYFTFIDNQDDNPVPAGFVSVGPGIRWEFDRATMVEWLRYLEGLRK